MKLHTNGIETNYTIDGDGAWLVFSHSLACSTEMWAPQIAAYSKRYKVLCYDTRGHGEPAGLAVTLRRAEQGAES